MKVKVLVTAVAIAMGSSAASAGEMMTGEQIKAFFSDKTCDIEKVDVSNSNKKHLSAYWAADGTRLVYIPWKSKTSKRKWWVDGDKICGSHPKQDDYCRNLMDMGDGTYHSIGDGEHLRTLSNCREGNQL